MGEQKAKQKVGIMNIRNKIFLCFIIPIVCMMIVGVVSYRKASDGMSSQFEETAGQTVNMGVEYMDLICSNIETTASRYVVDTDFESYVLGMPGKSSIEKSQYYSSMRLGLMSVQSSDDHINNIHLVTKDVSPMITTAVSEKLDGVYEEYIDHLKEETGLESSFPKWITAHPYLDEVLSLKPNETFITYQTQDNSKFAYIIIDVKKESLADILDNVNFGSGSYVAILNGDGDEIVKECGTDAFLANDIFSTESFYTDAVSGSELSGNKTVTYNNEEYLYIYQKSEKTGLMLCALIPNSTIVGQAEDIKGVTLVLVIVAAVFSLIIGSLIATGIQNNMKRISKKLDEVAKGNLSVSVEAKGKDEFQSLARSATNMVENNKNLVVKLSGTATDLEDSAKSVNDASNDISNCSTEITQAIDEISKGVDRQSEHALECVNITNNLSEKIKNITTDVSEIEDLVRDTETLIRKGTEIVGNLAERANETSALTGKVGDNITKLEAESESINEFVDTIGAIAKKTNLLSLNASIEAARAGEAGKGFAVVADEIRVLADNSAKASAEIGNRVRNINAKTGESVSAAEDAAEMVSKQQEAVDDVIAVFDQINDQMKTLVGALSKISDSAMAADAQRKETVDAVDNISAIIEQTAASSSLVRNMTGNLLNSVDRLGATADSLDENMNGLKNEIAAFTVE